LHFRRIFDPKESMGLTQLVAYLLVAPALAYSQPGAPPQCVGDSSCVFFAPLSPGSQEYLTWDLGSLCAGAGAEYYAIRDIQCKVAAGVNCPAACFNNCDPNLDLKPTMSFNICGKVAKPIAPVTETGGTGGVGDPQTMPIPYTHGSAIMFIEGAAPVPIPGYGPAGGCADLDTCDQLYNPTCAPNSLNYPATSPSYNVDAFFTARANTCTQMGAAWCSSSFSYWCCSVKSAACTKNAEVVAYYDGSPPIFSPLIEGKPNGVSLTYTGEPDFSQDPFPCGSGGAVDPSTGLSPSRSPTFMSSVLASMSSLPLVR
jgi:hypothetical protein